MVDHFHNQVIARGKIGTGPCHGCHKRIEKAIEYYYAITKCLEKGKVNIKQ